MSTKENSFEIGELVRLKYTHSVGIVLDKKDSIVSIGKHYYSYKVKWQPRRWQVTPQDRQWYPARELQPLY